MENFIFCAVNVNWSEISKFPDAIGDGLYVKDLTRPVFCGKLKSLVKNLVTFPRFYLSYWSLFPKFIFLLVNFSALNFELNIDRKTKNFFKTFYLRYILQIKREQQQHI